MEYHDVPCASVHRVILVMEFAIKCNAVRKVAFSREVLRAQANSVDAALSNSFHPSPLFFYKVSFDFLSDSHHSRGPAQGKKGKSNVSSFSIYNVRSTARRFATLCTFGNSHAASKITSTYLLIIRRSSLCISIRMQDYSLLVPLKLSIWVS